MKRRITLSIATFAVLAACAPSPGTTDPTASTGQTEAVGSSTSQEDAESSSGGDVSAPSPPSLAGRWRSPCFAQGDGTFARLDFDLGAETWALDYRVNGDEACTVPLVTVAIEGSYALEGPAAVEGAWNAIFGFDSKTITAHAQPLVEALDAAGCGSEPWSLDVSQSVAQGCAPFGQYPLKTCAADYDLVARDGDALRFGQRPSDNDMCGPERRPTQLSSLVLAPM